MIVEYQYLSEFRRPVIIPPPKPPDDPYLLLLDAFHFWACATVRPKKLSMVSCLKMYIICFFFRWTVRVPNYQISQKSCTEAAPALQTLVQTILPWHNMIVTRSSNLLEVSIPHILWPTINPWLNKETPLQRHLIILLHVLPFQCLVPSANSQPDASATGSSLEMANQSPSATRGWEPQSAMAEVGIQNIQESHFKNLLSNKMKCVSKFQTPQNPMKYLCFFLNTQRFILSQATSKGLQISTSSRCIEGSPQMSSLRSTAVEEGEVQRILPVRGCFAFWVQGWCVFHGGLWWESPLRAGKLHL